jgi:hypothetical protein
MRPSSLSNAKLSTTVPKRVALDAPAVADDPSFLQPLNAQCNLRDFIKAGLPGLFA